MLSAITSTSTPSTDLIFPSLTISKLLSTTSDVSWITEPGREREYSDHDHDQERAVEVEPVEPFRPGEGGDEQGPHEGAGALERHYSCFSSTFHGNPDRNPKQGRKPASSHSLEQSFLSQVGDHGNGQGLFQLFGIEHHTDAGLHRLPGHLVSYFPALVETINIAAAAPI